MPQIQLVRMWLAKFQVIYFLYQDKYFDYVCKVLLDDHAFYPNLAERSARYGNYNTTEQIPRELALFKPSSKSNLTVYKKTYNEYVQILEKIDCRLDDTGTITSKRYAQTMLEAGQRLIVKPRFMWHQKIHKISNSSNMDGVCKLYGYPHHVKHLIKKNDFICGFFYISKIPNFWWTYATTRRNSKT